MLTTFFGAVPVGAMLGFLFGDPANGELDTALAWGSTGELLKQLGLGAWLSTTVWTAIYFERVNTRLRKNASGASSSMWLPVTALVLALFLLGPIALAVACVAWMRIVKVDVPLARGAATTAVAGLAGAIGTIVWIFQPPF